MFIDGVSVMTAPVQFATGDDTYARMTVSLNSWGFPMEGGAFYLECELLFKGKEGL